MTVVGAETSLSIEAKFSQQLASNEKKIRDRGLKKLRLYLIAKSRRVKDGINRPELLRIWKGLFYCMWMSDKPLVQEELAKNISEIMSKLNHNAKASFLFLETFFETMGREWSGIDRLRMDKFLLLVRFMLHESLLCLKRIEWEDGTVDWFTAILKSGPLSSLPAGPKARSGSPLGLRYHIIDAYLDELISSGHDSMPPSKITKLLSPFCNILCESKNESLCDKVEEKIFQAIIDTSDVALEVVAQYSEVVVPDERLNYDYLSISEELMNATKTASAIGKNGKRVFKLVRKFKELHDGKMSLDELPDLMEDDSNRFIKEREEELVSTIMADGESIKQENIKYKKETRKTKKKPIFCDDSFFDALGETESQDMLTESEKTIKKQKRISAKAARKAEALLKASEQKAEETTAVEEEASTTTTVAQEEVSAPMENGVTEEVADETKTVMAPEENVDVAQPDAEALSQMFIEQAKKKLKAQKAKRLKRKKALLMQLVSEPAATEEDGVTEKKMKLEEPAVVVEEASPPTEVVAKPAKKSKKRKAKKAESDTKVNGSSENGDAETVSSSTVAGGDLNISISELISKVKESTEAEEPNFASFVEPKVRPMPTFFKTAESKVEKTKTEKTSKKSKKSAKKSTKKVVNTSDSVTGTPKRVIFEMSRCQVKPFRKNERPSAVGGDLAKTPTFMAFDPTRTPESGLLKPRRKKAADFF